MAAILAILTQSFCPPASSVPVSWNGHGENRKLTESPWTRMHWRKRGHRTAAVSDCHRFAGPRDVGQERDELRFGVAPLDRIHVPTRLALELPRVAGPLWLDDSSL
jgi:hypothetical protein